MLTIQEMQDNIISLLGHEHPDTIHFFELCDHSDDKQYLKYMFDVFMAVNSPKLKHIHYSVRDLQSDVVIKIRCMELNSAIDFTSLFGIIPAGKNKYISILGIVVE